MLAGAFAAASADAAPLDFIGFKSDTWCCGNASSIRLEWSSDFGVDYVMQSDGYLGLFTPIQPPDPGPVWAFGSVEADRSVGMKLYRDLGGGISLGADGLIDIGAAGPVGLSTVHHIKHTLTLANSSTQYGVGASADLHGDFFFDGVSSSAPIYWGVEWTLALMNEVDSSALNAKALLSIDDGPASGPLPLQSFGPSRTLTGGAFGINTDGSFRLTSLSSLEFGGAAILDWDLRIAFAGSAFDDIPDQLVLVPEPGTLTLLLSAVGAGLALRTGRRGRRRSVARRFST
jgi:hypothetical protein